MQTKLKKLYKQIVVLIGFSLLMIVLIIVSIRLVHSKRKRGDRLVGRDGLATCIKENISFLERKPLEIYLDRVENYFIIKHHFDNKQFEKMLVEECHLNSHYNIKNSHRPDHNNDYKPIELKLKDENSSYMLYSYWDIGDSIFLSESDIFYDESLQAVLVDTFDDENNAIDLNNLKIIDYNSIFIHTPGYSNPKLGYIGITLEDSLRNTMYSTLFSCTINNEHPLSSFDQCLIDKHSLINFNSDTDIDSFFEDLFFFMSDRVAVNELYDIYGEDTYFHGKYDWDYIRSSEKDDEYFSKKIEFDDYLVYPINYDISLKNTSLNFLVRCQFNNYIAKCDNIQTINNQATWENVSAMSVKNELLTIDRYSESKENGDRYIIINLRSSKIVYDEVYEDLPGISRYFFSNKNNKTSKISLNCIEQVIVDRVEYTECKLLEDIELYNPENETFRSIQNKNLLAFQIDPQVEEIILTYDNLEINYLVEDYFFILVRNKLSDKLIVKVWDFETRSFIGNIPIEFPSNSTVSCSPRDHTEVISFNQLSAELFSNIQSISIEQDFLEVTYHTNGIEIIRSTDLDLMCSSCTYSMEYSD